MQKETETLAHLFQEVLDITPSPSLRDAITAADENRTAENLYKAAEEMLFDITDYSWFDQRKAKLWEKSMVKIRSVFEEAACRGSAEGAIGAGYMYARDWHNVRYLMGYPYQETTSIFVNQNLSKALGWFEMSVKLGNPRAGEAVTNIRKTLSKEGKVLPKPPIPCKARPFTL